MKNKMDQLHSLFLKKLKKQIKEIDFFLFFLEINSRLSIKNNNIKKTITNNIRFI